MKKTHKIESKPESKSAKLISELLKKYSDFDISTIKEPGLNKEMIKESKKIAIQAASFLMMREDLKTYLDLENLTPGSIAGDGNCFFRTISAAINGNDCSMKGQEKYPELRAQAVKHMEVKIKSLEKDLSKASEEHERLSITSELDPLKTRKALASRDKEFAETPEIEALSHALAIPFTILSWHGGLEGPYPLPEGEESRINKHCIHHELYTESTPIVLLHEINHYNLAIPKK